MRLRLQKILNLDLRRVDERIAVHFGGDAAKMLDYVRACIPATSVDEISKMIAMAEAGIEDPESPFVGIRNRFAEPAATGYRDLKMLTRDPGTGHISTLRVVGIDYDEETFFNTANHVWGLRFIFSRAALRGIGVAGPAVIVADNYHREDENSCLAVYGFPDRDHALTYAIRRLKNSLRTLKPLSISVDDLKAAWIMLGEDTAILDADGKDTYLTSNILAFLAELDLDDPGEYWDLEEEFSLNKLAIDLEP